MENLSASTNQVGWKAKYIRTDGYISGAVYPVVTVISSNDELKQYYEKYSEKYDFSSRSNAYLGTSIGFIDGIEHYSDTFFAESFLVLVLLEEGSGAIRHKVESVEENGDIVISRLLPEMGTADMAQWHIIIELDKTYYSAPFFVKTLYFW